MRKAASACSVCSLVGSDGDFKKTCQAVRQCTTRAVAPQPRQHFCGNHVWQSWSCILSAILQSLYVSLYPLRAPHIHSEGRNVESVIPRFAPLILRPTITALADYAEQASNTYRKAKLPAFLRILCIARILLVWYDCDEQESVAGSIPCDYDIMLMSPVCYLLREPPVILAD